MKFLKVLLLMLITIVLATSSTKKENADNMEYDLNECQKDFEKITEYEHCLRATFNSTNTVKNKYSCMLVNSDHCKKFFDKPLSFFPNCDKSIFLDLGLEFLFYPNYKEIVQSFINVLCTTNNNGKYCSFNFYDNFKDITEETCKSKRCTKVFHNFIDVLSKTYNSKNIKIRTKRDLSSKNMSFNFLNGNIEANLKVIREKLDSAECRKNQIEDDINYSLIGKFTVGIMLIIISIYLRFFN